MRGLITKYKPVIIAEVLKKLTQEERLALTDLLRDLGYRIQKFDRENGGAGELITNDTRMKWKHYDGIAFPE